MRITLMTKNARHLLGHIPDWLNEANPAPARDQLHHAYVHGGGWWTMPGWSMDRKSLAITYDGDPPLNPVALIHFRDETIAVYPHAWVAIIRHPLNGWAEFTFEVARMD